MTEPPFWVDMLAAMGLSLLAYLLIVFMFLEGGPH